MKIEEVITEDGLSPICGKNKRPPHNPSGKESNKTADAVKDLAKKK